MIALGSPEAFLSLSVFSVKGVRAAGSGAHAWCWTSVPAVSVMVQSS